MQEFLKCIENLFLLKKRKNCRALTDFFPDVSYSELLLVTCLAITSVSLLIFTASMEFLHALIPRKDLSIAPTNPTKWTAR